MNETNKKCTYLLYFFWLNANRKNKKHTRWNNKEKMDKEISTKKIVERFGIIIFQEWN